MNPRRIIRQRCTAAAAELLVRLEAEGHNPHLIRDGDGRQRLVVGAPGRPIAEDLLAQVAVRQMGITRLLVLRSIARQDGAHRRGMLLWSRRMLAGEYGGPEGL